MRSPPFTVIFDLDGTLIDTAGDLTAALNSVLAAEKCAPAPIEVVRPLIGHGARALIEKGLQLNGQAYDDTRLALLTEHFIQYYSAHIADHSVIRHDLRDTLDAFIREGIKLGICTNKRTQLANQLLEAISLEHYFSAVIGSGELPFTKPDPRMLHVTITESGGTVERAIMIGDSKTDVDTARAANVPILLVDFGYTSTPARELGADDVISDWQDLRPLLKKMRLI